MSASSGPDRGRERKPDSRRARRLAPSHTGVDAADAASSSVTPRALRASGAAATTSADGVPTLDEPLQAPPGGERQAREVGRRDVGDVEGDDAEAAGLEHQPERLDGALDEDLPAHPFPIAAGRVAARPEHAVEDHARGRGGTASKVSVVSTTAARSPRAVAAASVAICTLVRPEEAGPTTSDVSPQGQPPANRASSHARPVDAVRPGSGGAPSVGDRAVEPPGPEQSLDLETCRLHAKHLRLFFASKQLWLNRIPG